METITVALIGNPNCGKTTIFNNLTGAHYKVANWSGVTVERIEGSFTYKNYKIKVIDLPGIYSLTSYSMEELVSRDYILKEKPDLILNVVDAGNLDRNLYLTTQLIEMKTTVLMALNMYDEAKGKGLKINKECLSNLLGMPIIPTVGSHQKGIEDIKDSIIELYEKQNKVSRHVHVSSFADLKDEVEKVQQLVLKNDISQIAFSSRWIAIRLLEKDNDIYKKIQNFPNFAEIEKQIQQSTDDLEKRYNDDIESLITDRRYGFITGAIKECVKVEKKTRKDRTGLIDKVVLNKYLGYPILLFLLWLLFFLTFKLGQYPMDWIESFVGYLSAILTAKMPDSIFKSLVVDGVLSGIGGVIVFLPNIVLLFLGISLLEDSGYMARAAFLMDKVMHKFGLHGKSFIPMIMGFGCNVPAIMATRTLENPKDKILTVLINPFISCSARLPVYILFAGTFFPNHEVTVIMSLYLIGIMMAFASAKLFNKTIFKQESTPFVMELPPYRKPTSRSIIIHMWERTKQYLKKIGGIILVFSIIVWALGEFPRSAQIDEKYDNQITTVEENYEQELKNANIKYGENSPETAFITADIQEETAILEAQRSKEQMDYSCIGRFGNFIHPILKPLGFSPEMGIALTTGIAAKEIVMSTLSVLYKEETATSMSLSEILLKPENNITPLIAFSFLLFVLLYIPCIGTFVTIGKEIGWKWAIFSLFYQLFIAWGVSFIVFQVGSLFI